MKDYISKMIEKAINEVEKEQMKEKIEVVVAEMDNDAMIKMQVYRKKRREIRDTIKLVAQEIEVRLKRELEYAVEPLERDYDDEHNKLWDYLYKKYNLDPDKDYSINIEDWTINELVKDVPPAASKYKN